MAKGTLYLERFQKLGFQRTWSRSNGWPGEQLRLKQTAERGWLRVEFGGPTESVYPRRGTVKELIKESERSSLNARVGDDLARVLSYQVEDLAMWSKYEEARRSLCA